MKATRLILRTTCAILGANLALTSIAQTDKPSESKTLTREEALLVHVTAKVQDINREKREITLRGPLGNEVTFTVDERVKRLDEIKAGDEVNADYYVSVAAELREPTSEEKATPLTVLQAKGRAPKDTAPAGGGLRMFKVVATVEGLDRPTQSVTLKGPRGNYTTVRARDPRNLEKLHLGDTIVVTYAEALAISVEKATTKTDKE